MPLTKPDTPDKVEQIDSDTIVRWSMKPKKFSIKKLQDEKEYLVDRLAQVKALLANVNNKLK